MAKRKLPSQSTVLDVLAIIAGALSVGAVLYAAFGVIVGVGAALGFLFLVRVGVTIWNQTS